MLLGLMEKIIAKLGEGEEVEASINHHQVGKLINGWWEENKREMRVFFWVGGGIGNKKRERRRKKKKKFMKKHENKIKRKMKKTEK